MILLLIFYSFLQEVSYLSKITGLLNLTVAQGRLNNGRESGLVDVELGGRKGLKAHGLRKWGKGCVSHKDLPPASARKDKGTLGATPRWALPLQLC